MKKKLYMLGLSLMLVGATFGCGKKKENTEKESGAANTVQTEIVSFVNEKLPAIQAEHDTAITTYNSYFEGEGVNIESFGTDLNDVAIPSMETFISNIEAIETTSDEVANLKTLYLQGAQKQYDAMVLTASAISEQNADYLTEANNCISAADSYFVQYESQLRLLAVDFDIDINGSFSSEDSLSTATDTVTVDSETSNQ